MHNQVFARKFMLLLSLLTLLGPLISLADESDQNKNSLTGKWRLEETYCSPGDVNRVTTTNIFPIQSLGFEPQVTIEFSEKNGEKFLRKVVDARSCKSNKVNEPFFIDSTYKIDTVERIVRGQSVLELNSSRVVHGIVNHKAFRSCGGTLNGLTLSALTWLRFPGYFTSEMKRSYHASVVDDRLYLHFFDDEICGSNVPTVMVFKK